MKRHQLIGVIKFDGPSLTHDVVGFAYRALTKNCRFSCRHSYRQYFLGEGHVDLIGEDAQGTVFDRYISAIESLARSEVMFNLIGTNNGGLIAVLGLSPGCDAQCHRARRQPCQRAINTHALIQTVFISDQTRLAFVARSKSYRESFSIGYVGGPFMAFFLTDPHITNKN